MGSVLEVLDRVIQLPNVPSRKYLCYETLNIYLFCDRVLRRKKPPKIPFKDTLWLVQTKFSTA